jgi:hypothetical protein
MLSTITISKAKDKNGQQITPEIAFQVGLSAHAASLRARFRFADDLTLTLFRPFIDRIILLRRPKDFKSVSAPRSQQAKTLVI